MASGPSRPMSTLSARPSVLLVGDSITQHSFRPTGWGSHLASFYMRKADVINRGFSGYNTAWALEAFPKVVGSVRRPILLATLFFGANDAVLPHGPARRQHIPVPAYSANLRAMATALRVAGTQHILLITPPPVDEAARAAQNTAPSGTGPEVPDRLNAVTGEYAAACCEVAKDLSVPVLDLWTHLQAQPDWRGLLSDGLHLSERGDAVVAAALQHLLLRELPATCPRGLPWDFPEHGEIESTAECAVFMQPYLPGADGFC